jgi:cation:H+ antiporter
MSFVYFLFGLIGLFFGADWLVKGAAGFAAHYRISPMIIGLTFIGFWTSTPELMVSLNAALADAPSIAIGNVAGSNIANILLILGASAAITAIDAPFSTLKTILAWMMGAALVCVPMFGDGFLSRTEGFLLLSGAGIFLMQSIEVAPDQNRNDDLAPPLGMNLVIAALGIATVLIAANFVVTGATQIAQSFGISQALIGLTIVAIGTSLPELATATMAAYRGQGEVAIGTVIGANIFNILAILGVTALIAPVPIEARFVENDVWVMLATSGLLVGIVWLRGKVSRAVGGILLCLYALYIAWSVAVQTFSYNNLYYFVT